MKINREKINKIKEIKDKGFTLVETLVSLALFSIVLVISGGVILSVVNSNKENQAIAAVASNLNYSLDSMIRDIKTGYLYKCGTYNGLMTIDGLKTDNSNTNQCTNSSSIILISTISGNDVVVKYEFKQVTNSNGYIEKTVYNSGGVSSSYNVTDRNNVNIQSLGFKITNPDSLDCGINCPLGYGQPSVFVTIKGFSDNENESINASRFFVQTFISQRLINRTNFKNQ